MCHICFFLCLYNLSEHDSIANRERRQPDISGLREVNIMFIFKYQNKHLKLGSVKNKLLILVLFKFFIKQYLLKKWLKIFIVFVTKYQSYIMLYKNAEVMSKYNIERLFPKWPAYSEVQWVYSAQYSEGLLCSVSLRRSGRSEARLCRSPEIILNH